MRVVVVGAGGHARSVIDALRTSAADFEPVACTDPDPARAGSAVDGVPVLGDDGVLEGLREEGIEGACLGVGGVGDNLPRAQLHARLRGIGFRLPAVVHGRAYVAASATLGEATVVLAGAIVGAGCQLGNDVIVNSGAIVEHDCVIGDHVHLASGCALGGGVGVDVHAHVGLGARVLQERRVGENAIVGAGAVVVRDVPPGQVVVGCPARPRGA
jgi:UDP-perosamine 4-acetyltransferase